MEKFKGPFVNLNGASRKDLVQQAFNVSHAAEALIQALGLAAPHGRDYQTVSSDTFKHDRKVWDKFLSDARVIYETYRNNGERIFTEGERK